MFSWYCDICYFLRGKRGDVDFGEKGGGGGIGGSGGGEGCSWGRLYERIMN